MKWFKRLFRSSRGVEAAHEPQPAEPAGAGANEEKIANGANETSSDVAVHHVRIVSKQRIRLTDRSPGYSLGEIASYGGLMAEHRRILEQLVSLPETTALGFLERVGVSKPMRFSAQNIDKVFSNMRSVAQLGPADGELFYVSIGYSSSSASECLYVRHVDGSGYEAGLIVCKLMGGTILAYHNPEIGKKLGV